jgi:hypothetical protein
MFWFAGLVGMAIESQRVRRWLAASSTAASGTSTIVQPQSYRASFNPFPALVIGVTGSAMAAHYQKYVFQVGLLPLQPAKKLAIDDKNRFLRFKYTHFGAIFCWVSPLRDA